MIFTRKNDAFLHADGTCRHTSFVLDRRGRRSLRVCANKVRKPFSSSTANATPLRTLRSKFVAVRLADGFPRWGRLSVRIRLLDDRRNVQTYVVRFGPSRTPVPTGLCEQGAKIVRFLNIIPSVAIIQKPPQNPTHKLQMNRLFRERVGGDYLPYPEVDDFYETKRCFPSR